MIPTKYKSLSLLVPDEKTFFKFQPFRSKDFPWRPCFSSNQDEMRNFIEGLQYMLPVKCCLGLQYMLPVKCCFHLSKCFHGRRFLETVQSETRIACGGNVCFRIETKGAILIEGLLQLLPTERWSILPTSIREDIQKSTNRVC